MDWLIVSAMWVLISLINLFLYHQFQCKEIWFGMKYYLIQQQEVLIMSKYSIAVISKFHFRIYLLSIFLGPNWVPIKSEKIISGESFIVFTIIQWWSISNILFAKILCSSWKQFTITSGWCRGLALAISTKGKMIILDQWHMMQVGITHFYRQGILRKDTIVGIVFLRSNWQSAASSCSFGTPDY